MSPKHPKTIIVVVLLAILDFSHVTHVLDLLWKDIPGWARTTLVAAATHVAPSALNLVLGFSLGIGFMILGPSLLTWLFAKLWPNHEKPKKRRGSGAKKAPGKPRKAPRKPRKARSPKTEDGGPDMG